MEPRAKETIWDRKATLLEVIGISLLGGVALLFSTTISRPNPDRQAVDWAAQDLKYAVARAQGEAIRREVVAGLALLEEGLGGYVVFLDRNGNGRYDPDRGEAVHRTDFGQGRWKEVRVAEVLGERTLLFDPSGALLTQGSTRVILEGQREGYRKAVEIPSLP